MFAEAALASEGAFADGTSVAQDVSSAHMENAAPTCLRLLTERTPFTSNGTWHRHDTTIHVDYPPGVPSATLLIARDVPAEDRATQQPVSEAVRCLRAAAFSLTARLVGTSDRRSGRPTPIQTSTESARLLECQRATLRCRHPNLQLGLYSIDRRTALSWGQAADK